LKFPDFDDRGSGRKQCREAGIVWAAELHASGRYTDAKVFMRIPAKDSWRSTNAIMGVL
jgi:hypothetical protein